MPCKPTVSYKDRITRTLYCNCRVSARRRGIVFALDYSDFKELVCRPCHYCDSPGSVAWAWFQKKKGTEFFYNGIDRQDSNGPYILSNVVPCCKFCNQGKSTLSVQEFFQWIKKVHDHNKL